MYFLGIHLDGSAALIRKKNGGIEWVKRFDVKRFDTLLPLLEGKPYQLVTGLLGSATLLRTLKLQLRTRREILAALPFQIEGLLPTPLDGLIFKPVIYPNEVLLFAVKKNSLEEHLSLCADQGLDPEWISCVPLALWRFSRHFFPKTADLLHFHFGEKENLLIAIEGGQLKLSHAFFSDDPHNLERTFAFAKKKYPQHSQMLVTGECPEFTFPIHLEQLHLPPSNQEMGQHAIALGLALDACARDKESLQLRYGPYTSPRVRKKRKRQLIRYLSLCAVSFLMALCGIQNALKKEEKKIFAALPDIKAPTAQQAIEIAEKNLLEERNSFSPRPHLPKVSDVLAWLSSDPLFSPKDGELTIDEFRYQLIPDSNKKNSLRARIELQVRYSTPSIGRLLREALTTDRHFIDQKEEVKWKGEHNRAKIIFQLKSNFASTLPERFSKEYQIENQRKESVGSSPKGDARNKLFWTTHASDNRGNKLANE